MPGYREGGGKGIPGGGAGPAHLYGALAFQPVILPLLPEPYGYPPGHGDPDTVREGTLQAKR